MSTITVKFTLPNTKPFSINNLHYGRRKVRTAQARKWGDDIHKLINNDEIQTAINVLQCNFNPLVHAFAVSYTFQMPKSKLYTLKGIISKTSFDVDNIAKPLTDLLFDARFFKRGIKNININDSFIQKITSQKIASEDDTYNILVQIDIIDHLS